MNKPLSVRRRRIHAVTVYKRSASRSLQNVWAGHSKVPVDRGDEPYRSQENPDGKVQVDAVMQILTIRLYSLLDRPLGALCPLL